MHRSPAVALVLLALCSVAGASAPPQCPDPLVDLTSERLEEVFVGLVDGGVGVPDALGQVADFALAAAPIGTRVLVDGKCHEVQRVVVSGFHEGPHGYGDVEREAGEDRGGGSHRVASFQRRWSTEYQGRMVETWVDLTATATIGESAPDGLDLEVSPASLCVGGSAEAVARVRCGACPAAGETVAFEVTGNAVVAPGTALTDDSGAAHARVTAEDVAEQLPVLARSGELLATRMLAAAACCTYWDLDATFDYRNHDRYDTVNEQFRSRALFPGLALGNYVGLELCPTAPEAVMRRMRRTGAVVPATAREVVGSFDDAVYWFYEGEDRFDGSARGSPRWRLEVGPEEEEAYAACEIQGPVVATTVHLVFRMARDSVFVSWPEDAIAADGYESFDLDALIDVDRLRACAPFTVEVGFDDPYAFERATLRFTPAAGR